MGPQCRGQTQARRPRAGRGDRTEREGGAGSAVAGERLAPLRPLHRVVVPSGGLGRFSAREGEEVRKAERVGRTIDRAIPPSAGATGGDQGREGAAYSGESCGAGSRGGNGQVRCTGGANGYQIQSRWSTACIL